jgi:hypothetical protein
MNKVLASLGLLAWAMTSGVIHAKLPPPDDATKAKAAETSARAAWQAKVEGYLLCKSQDKVAAQYRKTAAKPVAPAPAPVPAVAKPASAAASGTPVALAAAAAPLPPCTDPGPFAYNAPEQKPLETSGAHSPTGTAASPPSVRPESAQMAPAKK